jgi:hypothetical protein
MAMYSFSQDYGKYPDASTIEAVILWTDNSATSQSINQDGHVVDASGCNLLDPANPLWHGTPPVIAWPE